jgi:hypothetical protein
MGALESEAEHAVTEVEDIGGLEPGVQTLGKFAEPIEDPLVTLADQHELEVAAVVGGPTGKKPTAQDRPPQP